MLYLIGGPPRCGKTTLAEGLARAKSLPYFSIDHVASVITPYVPEGERESAFPLHAARQEAGHSNDVFHARFAPDEIVGFYLRQAETCWPGVKNFVEYALRDGHDLILEGWQILPRLAHTFAAPENRGRLKILFLYKLDAEAIAAGLRAGPQRKHDWVLNLTKREETFPAIARMIGRFGAHTEAEARKYDLPSLNTEADFDLKIAAALRTLL